MWAPGPRQQWGGVHQAGRNHAKGLGQEALRRLGPASEGRQFTRGLGGPLSGTSEGGGCCTGDLPGCLLPGWT